MDQSFAPGRAGRGVHQMVGQQGIEDGFRLAPAVGKLELAPGPELSGTKIDHGLDHVQGRRVGRGLCPSRLAHDHVHFGKPAEDHVPRLQVVERFGHGSPGHGDRHVHDHSLVEGLQELPGQWLHRLVGDQGHEQRLTGARIRLKRPTCQQRPWRPGPEREWSERAVAHRAGQGRRERSGPGSTPARPGFP